MDQIWYHGCGITKATSVHADHILSCRFDEIPNAVLAATGGRKADAVYDGPACLGKRGMKVSYGNASGAVVPKLLTNLKRAGSIIVIHPTLADYIATPEELIYRATLLLDRISIGIVTPMIGSRHPLDQAATAHQAKQTTVSTILLP